MKSFDEQFDDSVRGAFDNYQEAVDPAALSRLRGSLDAAGLSAVELDGNENTSGASGGLADAGAQKPNSPGPQRSGGLSRRIMYLAAGFLLAAGVLVVLGYYGITRMWVSEDAVVVSTESVIGDDTGFADTSSSADGTSATSRAGASSATRNNLVDATASTTRNVTPPSDKEPGISQGVAPVISESTIPPEVESLYTLTPADSLANNTLMAAHDSVVSQLAHIPPDEDAIEAPIPPGPLRSALPSTQPADLAISTNGSGAESRINPGQSTQLSRASLVLGSNFNHTNDGLSEGIGLSFGALRQWQLVPKVRLVTGGLLAWNQFSLANSEMAQQTDRLTSTEGSLNASIETETRYTTIALEIPLQGMLEVYRDGARSLSVGAGLSSMVYLSETTVREGVQYQGEVLVGPEGEFLVNSTVRSFESREEFAAFDRIDAGRLLNLSVLYELGGVRRPVMVELFTKQPLGNLTSSEITFGMTGITIRYGIW